ncbi:relaxase domain-containing protein [Conexibacter sp. W3-3-2]|uniref:MobF family relaxase n=1 Tax=Conexibacter sp. W3-3-2 TaxID=2675227 RepID=UPI0012B78A35|nr:MobF family relaxase [Conexibacter sp. W3-3-2]MTD43780.1 relaxase domain-containing protein [Conexibacter sp. W3-3-2]
MLSIGKLAAGKEQYYIESVAHGQDDYYTGSGEAPGSWIGTGAGELGLSGTVEPDKFTAIIEGTTPDQKTSLRPTTAKVTVDGYDLTFSAPKSVSLLYGVGDERVSLLARDAHDVAVRQALGYLEREACQVRRGAGGKRVLPASGVIAAAFRHRSSRAGDPQLHTHTVVANAGKAEGTWSTLDGRMLYAHAKTAGYLYQAALREQLTRDLGVEWLAVENGMAEIRGVDPGVLLHFSQRSHEVEEHLNEVGSRGRRARELAVLETRKRKDYSVAPDRLHQVWRARAAELGFGRDEIDAVLGQARPQDDSPRPLLEAAERLASPHGVTRNASTFDRRDVLRDWATEHRSGASVEQLERLTDVWLASDAAVPLPAQAATPAGGSRYSTREMLAIERELVDGSHRRRSAGVARARPEAVEDAIDGRPTLTQEQAVVIRGLTRSGDGVQVVRAAAGTGKTFALDAAREAWSESGVPVVGCALSARAAVELQSQSGIRSDTVARLQRQIAQGHGVPKGGVLVVDEAGMVGSRQLAALAAAAERADAKLVLVGDDHQLPEIDAGGGLSGIAKRIGALQLRTVMRQQSEWDREALAHLRSGRIEEWAEAYRDHGRIVSSATAETTRRSLVSDWWIAARDPQLDTVMIAHRRTDVADLNHRARQLMLADGRLGDAEVTAHDRDFAVGDRVLAKRNDRRLDIVNGARGVVVDVDPDRRAVLVDVAGGDTVKLDAGYLDAGHLDHGYALTAHAAQGATVDKSFVLGSDDLYREWGYTALSRHRIEARYYTVSLGRPEPTLPGVEPDPDPLIEDLNAALKPSRRKQLALDSTKGQEIDESERPVGTFGDLRAAERDLRRASEERDRIAALLAEADARQRELAAELESTPRRKRAARAALGEALERQQAITSEWRGRGVELLADVDEALGRHGSFAAELELRGLDLADAHTADLPEVDAPDITSRVDAGPDLGM